MNLRPPKSEYFGLLLGGALLICAAVNLAWALEATTHENSGTPCAILENFGGDVEVLDPSRTQVVSLTKNYAIPCGGWVSSAAGWAIIHHRDGHDLRIGPNTFLEIPESHPDAKSDQVVLYRGEMFASTEGGAGELRIITANARVRVEHGTALINFSPEDQDTQLVALDGPAQLENRFEPEKKVAVKAGETTSLNFKELRVIPTYPRAVSIASLRAKMGIFRITPDDQTKIYATAEARAERRMAADLSNGLDTDSSAKPSEAPKYEDEKVVTNRKLASEAPQKVYSYRRTPVDPERSHKLSAAWARRMTAGENIGEQILFPDQFYGKPQKSKVLVTDPNAGSNIRTPRGQDAEKQRLIKELSEIQE